MTKPQEIERLLKRNVGKMVEITYDDQTEAVIVLSVDHDGFLCGPAAINPQQPALEFWVAFASISSVEIMNSAESPPPKS